MPIRPRSTPTFAGLTRAALALWILVAAAFATVPALAQRPAEASSWVWRDQTSGRLLYRTTAAGDRIPDFSGTGYMGGTQPVPDVETIVPHKRRVTVAPPASGDATPAIQAAIARVAAWPADLKGYRGLIQLSPGTYNIEGQIRIQTGGIILRGTPKTLLRAVGTDQRSLIAVGPDAGERAEIPGTRSEVADNYVPVGTTTLRVMQPGRFPAGSQVVVFRPATAEWIDAIGMNRIEVGKKGRRVNQWVGGGVLDQHYERTVERTVGDRLFLDAPLTNSLDRRHGPAYVYRYDFPGRIERIGLVNLHGEAVYDRSVLDRAGRETDEEHSSSFIDVDRTRNAWIEHVSARHFAISAVALRRHASQITVRHAESRAPVSRIEGRRRYSFKNDGQKNLMHDLYAEDGRHDFGSALPSHGPNVFLDARRSGESRSESGPHQRWATGTLYDGIQISGPNGRLGAFNAGPRGTGHGHSGANMVFWRSAASLLRVENPPTAQNWVIGCRGKIEDPNDFLGTPRAYYDRHEMTPELGDKGDNPKQSLFIAQRVERSRLAAQGGVRRTYAAGDYIAGTATAQLTLATEPVVRESVGGGALRFGMRRIGAGAPSVVVGGETIAAPRLVTDQMDGIITGTVALSAVALRTIESRGSLTIATASHLRLVWIEADLDLLPVSTPRNIPKERRELLETR